MSSREYVEKTRDFIKPILDNENAELVDVEFLKEKDNYYLRVFIEKEGGVDIETCEKISRKFSEILDKEDYIEEEYIFEVSSPGDRPFKCDRDFERNLNKLIKVKTYETISNKKTFSGKLIGFDEKQIIIEEDDFKYNINRDKIAKACVEFIF